jgi:hypothetical protein
MVGFLGVVIVNLAALILVCAGIWLVTRPPRAAAVAAQ